MVLWNQEMETSGLSHIQPESQASPLYPFPATVVKEPSEPQGARQSRVSMFPLPRRETRETSMDLG